MKSQQDTSVQETDFESWIDFDFTPLHSQCMFIHETGDYLCEIVEIVFSINDSGIGVQYGVKFLDESIKNLWENGMCVVEFFPPEHLRVL